MLNSAHIRPSLADGHAALGAHPHLCSWQNKARPADAERAQKERVGFARRPFLLHRMKHVGIFEQEVIEARRTGECLDNVETASADALDIGKHTVERLREAR